MVVMSTKKYPFLFTYKRDKVKVVKLCCQNFVI